MRTSYFVTIFIGIIIDQVTHAQRGSFWDEPLKKETVSMPPPTFHDTPTTTNVKEGHMAKLECSLQNLGTKKIIWRRRSDPNPLTIGRMTYVDDARIMVDHKPLTPGWPLLIKQVRKDDAGEYECQVSSKDRLLRRYVQLVVRRKKKKNRNRKKDRYKLSGSTTGDWNPAGLLPSNVSPSRGINITGRDFVNKNQKIILVCNATSINNGHPDDLNWFFAGQKLSTDANKKITIRKSVSLMDKTIHSVLEIKSAGMENTGIYVCRISDLQTTSKTVVVLDAGTVNKKKRTQKDATMKEGWKASPTDSNKKDKSSAHHHPRSLITIFTCIVLSLTLGHFNLLTSLMALSAS